MTLELKMLAWTLVLALVQIGLFSAARSAQYGPQWNVGARDETPAPLKPHAERLRRAQQNLFETLPLFIAAVLIAHIAGRESARTADGAQLYFWGRVIYVPLYAFGVPWLRTLVWMASLIGLIMIISAILT